MWNFLNIKSLLTYIYLPCETAGLEQLLVKGILKLPGVNVVVSSQCLLFILLVAVALLLPQLPEVGDALISKFK